MRQQVFTVVSVLLAVYLMITLSRDLLGLLSARERLSREEQAVQELQAEQQRLAQELHYVVSDEFVEKEARDKLLMSKPGETVVLLPQETDRESEGGPVSAEGYDEARDLANWEKWARVFGF